MKVAILHHDIEWPEQEFQRQFQTRGIEVLMYDVRSSTPQQIANYRPDIVLNRVYASVANRDYSAISEALGFLEQMEDLGLRVVNSHHATRNDYHKFAAFEAMEEAGVNTPFTHMLDGQDPVTLATKIGFPLIVKKDTGGRADHVYKADSLDQALTAIRTIEGIDDYAGDIILQSFAMPTEPKDYRVGVLNGKVLYFHGRTLISLNEDEQPWLASRSAGSELIKLDQAPEGVLDIAVMAAKSIGAYFDVLDIIQTESGALVIEHNPTPNFNPQYNRFIGINPVELIVEELTKK